eukprot:5567870-Pleurochrysis_carterae.AAC.1
MLHMIVKLWLMEYLRKIFCNCVPETSCVNKMPRTGNFETTTQTGFRAQAINEGRNKHPSRLQTRGLHNKQSR